MNDLVTSILFPVPLAKNTLDSALLRCAMMVIGICEITERLSACKATWFVSIALARDSWRGADCTWTLAHAVRLMLLKENCRWIVVVVLNAPGANADWKVKRC